MEADDNQISELLGNLEKAILNATEKNPGVLIRDICEEIRKSNSSEEKKYAHYVFLSTISSLSQAPRAYSLIKMLLEEKLEEMSTLELVELGMTAGYLETIGGICFIKKYVDIAHEVIKKANKTTKKQKGHDDEKSTKKTGAKTRMETRENRNARTTRPGPRN